MVSEKEQKVMKSLYEKGYTIAEIARICKRNKRTVTRYVTGKAKKKSILDTFKPYISRRMQEGQYSPTIIFKELKELGYNGQLGTVHLYVKEQKDQIKNQFEPIVTALKDDKEDDRNDELYQKIHLTTSNSEIIGHEKEIEDLISIYQQINEENGQICLLIGREGCGKTKIQKILLSKIALLEEQKEKPLILVVRSWVHYNRISYGVFISILRQYFNLKFGLDKKAIQNIIIKKFIDLEKSNYPPDINEKITVKLLLGIELSQRENKVIENLSFDQRQDYLLKYLSNFILRLSKIHKKMIIVIDDAQWMDNRPIRLLEEIVNRIKSYPIFIILLGRTKIKEILPNSIKRNPNFHLFLIHPLDQKSTYLFAKQILNSENISNKLFQYVLEISSGIPLYIESILNLLKKSGYLIENNGNIDLTAKIEDKLPQKMREVLIAQSNSLSSELKMICQTASVIGEPFGTKMLMHFIDYKGNLLDRIVELEDSKIIQKIHSENNELDSYTNKYEFTSKSNISLFYRKLMRKQRRNFHLKVAKTIEKSQKANLPEYYPILAQHYAKSKVKAKAGYYYSKTGEQLIKIGDKRAIKYYEQSRNMYEDDNEQLHSFLDISNRIANWYFVNGYFDKAHNEYIKLKDISEIENYKSYSAESTTYLAQIYLFKGEFKQAYMTARKARQIAEQAESKDILGFADLLISELECLSGKIDRALDRTNEIKSFLKNSTNKKNYCNLLLLNGEINLQKGSLQLAKNNFISSLEENTEINELHVNLRIYIDLMKYSLLTKDMNYFWEYSKRFLHIYAESADKQDEHAQFYLVNFYLLLAINIESFDEITDELKNEINSFINVMFNKVALLDYALQIASKLINPYPLYKVYDFYSKYLLELDSNNNRGMEYLKEANLLKNRIDNELSFIGLI